MIRFRTNVTGHRVAVVWLGTESSRLGRLSLLASVGQELCPASARELRNAPTPPVDTVKGDTFAENMREFGEVLRAEEELRDEEIAEMVREWVEPT